MALLLAPATVSSMTYDVVPPAAWVQVLRQQRGVGEKKLIVRPPGEFHTSGQPWIA